MNAQVEDENDTNEFDHEDNTSELDDEDDTGEFDDDDDMDEFDDEDDTGEFEIQSDEDADAGYINDPESDYSPDSDSDSSKSIDPQAQLLQDLQSDLNSLTLEAETVLSHQSRFTQLVIAGETSRLFKKYQKYGSMARLKVHLQNFFRVGDEDGRLKFVDETKVDETALSIRAKRPAHYGEAFMLNNTADDDEQKFDPNTAFVTSCRRDPFNPDPNEFIAHPLRIIEPTCIPYVTTLPWDPLATQIRWPAPKRMPRGLLSSINKIFSLEDEAARVRLFHHVTKWGPSPVFRSGIAQHLKCQYKGLFETAQDHYLGLTPETRAFLRDIYFQKQSLNVAERRLLALACRINEESVAIFWEDMAHALPAYEAMRVFMAAREIEKNIEFRKKMEVQKKERLREEGEYGLRMLAIRARAQADPTRLAHYQVDGRAQK